MKFLILEKLIAMNKFKPVCLLLLILFSSLSQSWVSSAKTEREFYQLTVYHFANASQEK